ncbi:LOW QUALITY PROTEIN: hypothetical protein RJ639_000093 [Escallonia herrerae]|uniref:indole-3-pyruvate monooxygenase n=1 Tax=Escallonia herrerae TaxID=1293975 RepID=A0AA88XBS6_9ASTE|nr:LOW QUALITY PROTEIN: hypothetical protein RJ639_000093 [Escallonia herrerae]
MVVIVGAGPAGLATSACLNLLCIPNVVLEREDCSASLRKKRSYDRLKLHLAKRFCQLPHMPFPSDAPTFMPRNGFIEYLDNYASHFSVDPLYNRVVESASFEEHSGKWLVIAKHMLSNGVEEYVGRFLVVATGENSEGYVPEIMGLDRGRSCILINMRVAKSCGRDVLVVGCGNSGMEIAYDLSNWGARASIVARNPVHVLTKEMVQLGMTLLKYIPVDFVDYIVLMLSKWNHGHLCEYGLRRPTKRPFYLKKETGRSPTIDVRMMGKIKAGQIQVLPSIEKVTGGRFEFQNRKVNQFDVVVFATGYKSPVRKWLKDGTSLFNEDGMPKKRTPDHWKGENGLYCAGFARGGLLGILNDAKNIADDICKVLAEKGD